jgi:hypothetical protein
VSTDGRQIRHPGRVVDISLGVTLAAAVLAMPNLALLLVYLALDLKGGHWDAVQAGTGCATLGVAVLALTVWLVRARR